MPSLSAVMRDESKRKSERIRKLQKENEQLKEALKELKEIGDYQSDRIQELNDENEHIKQTIKTMIDTERTELGKSILKQLWEQIE